jgi:zinc and cadmium transporter
MTLLWIVGATIVVSLISLIGIAALSVKKELLDKIVVLLVGFAAGGLIGGAFLHLLPEAIECQQKNTFLYVIIGFSIFFILERYFHWRHCHEGECNVHSFAYLNLVGDGVHNFCDGITIAISFSISVDFGIVTTTAILLHEIPQEIGDYAILVYSGLSKLKALFYNFLCALTSVLGGILGYFLSKMFANLSQTLIPFIAGGFIYVAASDLIPELHRQKDSRKANLSLITFTLGLLFMFAAKHSH